MSRHPFQRNNIKFVEMEQLSSAGVMILRVCPESRISYSALYYNIPTLTPRTISYDKTIDVFNTIQMQGNSCRGLY